VGRQEKLNRFQELVLRNQRLLHEVAGLTSDGFEWKHRSSYSRSTVRINEVIGLPVILGGPEGDLESEATRVRRVCVLGFEETMIDGLSHQQALFQFTMVSDAVAQKVAHPDQFLTRKSHPLRMHGALTNTREEHSPSNHMMSGAVARFTEERPCSWLSYHFVYGEAEKTVVHFEDRLVMVKTAMADHVLNPHLSYLVAINSELFNGVVQGGEQG